MKYGSIPLEKNSRVLEIESQSINWVQETLGIYSILNCLTIWFLPNVSLKGDQRFSNHLIQRLILKPLTTTDSFTGCSFSPWSLNVGLSKVLSSNFSFYILFLGGFKQLRPSLPCKQLPNLHLSSLNSISSLTITYISNNFDTRIYSSTVNLGQIGFSFPSKQFLFPNTVTQTQISPRVNFDTAYFLIPSI